MKLLLKLIIFTAIVMPLFSAATKAESTKAQIEALKQQIDAIQRQNQQQIEALKQQIKLMENAREADKEAVAEIKEEQKDAWYNKFKAQYKKGFTFQAGDMFKMRFRIMSQFRMTVDDPEVGNTSTDFSVGRLRFKWDGFAFKPWFLYMIQVEAKSGLELRDMFFTAAYDNNIMPRVGQWKVPFGRQQLNSSSALQFVFRSIVDDEFGLGRDRGVALMGGLGPKYNFSYSAGVFNGDGTNGKSRDSNLLYAGRIQFGVGGEGDKFKANSSYATGSAYSLVPNFAKAPTFVVGAAVAALPGLDCGRKSPESNACDRYSELGLTQANLTTITGDVSFKMPIFNIQGSYYGRWINPDEQGIFQGTAYDQGFNIQSGVFLLPKTVEVAGRFDYIDFDTSGGVLPPGVGATADSTWTVSPALNYYISHDHRWKIQAQYIFARAAFTQGAQDEDDNTVSLQLQAFF